jgi:hypothetical protein
MFEPAIVDLARTCCWLAQHGVFYRLISTVASDIWKQSKNQRQYGGFCPVFYTFLKPRKYFADHTIPGKL